MDNPTIQVMNADTKPELTEQQKINMNRAKGLVELEGGVVSLLAESLVEDMLLGKITADQLVDEICASHGIKRTKKSA